MKVTWLGHACFLLEQDGYQIVVDPYAGLDTYPELHAQAHEVYCSHGHFDHDAVGQVEILPKRESPFTVREIACFHDDRQGALRGSNTIRVFMAGGVTVAHLGDLGHLLTPELLEAIGTVDVVLVPVGGVYTVDAQGAKAVCDAINAKAVVPMHYRHVPYGLPNLGTAEDFVSLWPEEAVHRLDANCFAVGEVSGVLVPKFA